MSPNILRKPTKWTKRDKEFIEIIQQYELLGDLNNPSKANVVWQEIGETVKLQVAYCRRKWLQIKYNYFKLKKMICIGKVTEAMVRSNNLTSKYLDGTLDFLDPYVCTIPDKKLPSSVHTFFDLAFGINASSPSDLVVDAEKLIKVKENSYMEVIKDYKLETGIEPTSILPNIENEDSDNEKHPLFDIRINEIKSLDETNDYDPRVVLFNDVTNVTSLHDKVETNATAAGQSLLEDTIAKKRKGERSPVNLASFLVKYPNMAGASDLKHYMCDLAEVVCSRLIPENRQFFLSQVDLMVSELLEER